MSQENVDTLLRSFCRPSSRRLVARAIVGLACVSVVALTAIPAYGAFPGRNGRIAYVDPGLGISSVWPNGMGRQRLVREGRDPAYSPRGDRIAFTRFFEIRVDDPGVTRFELSRIELIGAAGRGRSVLTGGDDYSPAWAPGGKRISFSRTNPCDKYYDVEANCPPRVQMDREYGALIHRLGGHTRVWRRDGAVPVWSPDGKLISYVRTALYASRPDGSNPRQLVRRRSVSGGYDWSPDGSRVVFSYESRNGFRLGLVRRDGTGQRRLVRNGEEPSYSPDGRWIVFVRTSELRGRSYRHCDDHFGEMLWIMPASGGRGRPLRSRSGHRICGSEPDWQPLPVTTPANGQALEAMWLRE
jgi:Tol biopolymer transport system component